jgi:periodic tryptophan protein 2
MKQQGHSFDMSCISYSKDSQYIATGGADGKVKLWNTLNGFCFVTFTEHAAAITAVEFSTKKQILFSASIDNTIRAYDLIRYRNFRTFTAPKPEQFSCLAVDSSCEIVCAGSQDSFEIYMWSVQTGQLLEIMSGHQGPISGLSFSNMTGQLFSSSWDRQAMIWDVFSRDKQSEILQHQSEILAMALSPNGRIFATTTMNGKILLWNIDTATLEHEIDGRKDIIPGRKSGDKFVASRNNVNFTSICFTPDSENVIVGGNTKYVCIYNVSNHVLVKKFQITKNQSLDGMKQFLNSKNMTEAGPRDAIDQSGDHSDLEDRIDRSIPGVIKGDPSLRTTRPEVRTTCVKFATNGRSWAASTTEGLLIYTLDAQIYFDPFNLDIDATPANVEKLCKQKKLVQSFVMSLRIGQDDLTHKVLLSVPVEDIELLVKQIPTVYLKRVLDFMIGLFEKRKGIELYLKWTRLIFKHHTRYLRQNRIEYQAQLIGISKVLAKIYDDLNSMYSKLR